MIDFKVTREVIARDKTMDHLGPFGLHRMFLAELILGDIFVVEITHFSHLFKSNYIALLLV